MLYVTNVHFTLTGSGGQRTWSNADILVHHGPWGVIHTAASTAHIFYLLRSAECRVGRIHNLVTSDHTSDIPIPSGHNDIGIGTKRLGISHYGAPET